jgi:hypothetical protein
MKAICIALIALSLPNLTSCVTTQECECCAVKAKPATAADTKKTPGSAHH